MSYVIFILITILQAGGAAFLMRKSVAGNSGGSREVLEALTAEYEQKKILSARFEKTLAELVEFSDLKDVAGDMLQAQETLKTERGRFTITSAEVETVETRLRELEEIERELEASSLETNEEIEILKKKHSDLASRNTALTAQLAESSRQMEEVISKIEMSEQAREQMNVMKSELIQCEQRTDVLLAQIEAGNEQYFVLKKRYDALDIEYAQLYEKFSSAE